MSQVIILSDSTINGEIGAIRYIGPYAIASALREQNISTTVVDYFTHLKDIFSFISPLISQETVAVAISSTFLAPLASAHGSKKNRSHGLRRYYSGELWFESGDQQKEWLRQFKEKLQEKSPHIKLILGGVKSQFALWRPEFYEAFDYICIGSADKSFPLFIKQLIEKKPVATKSLLKRDNVIDNSIDLAEKFCPETRWSAADGIQPQESMPIEISRGCVFNCKFCHYDKKESFKKPLETLKAELIRNYEKFNITTYSFCDDCFNDHPQKVEAYCGLFKSLPFKIEWTAYSRVDVAVKFPHTIDLMIESGARGLYWGLESFNPEVARRAGKGTPTHLVKNFLMEFKNKYRGTCLSEGSFIVGLPGETKESLQSTLEWILENDPIDLASIGPLGLMPYVPSFDKVLFDYAEYSKNPEKYGFKVVRYQPHYWEHEQMNSLEADEIATEMYRQWVTTFRKGFLRSIWHYPHMKTLNFKHDEIMQAYHSSELSETYKNEISRRFNLHVQKYHQSLHSAFTK